MKDMTINYLNKSKKFDYENSVFQPTGSHNTNQIDFQKKMFSQWVEKTKISDF